MFRKSKKIIILIAAVATIALGTLAYAASGGFGTKKVEAKGLVGHWPLSEQNEKPVGSNLVTNGDMESISGWTQYGSPSVLQQSSTRAHGGTYSYKITSSSSYDGVYRLFNVTAGKTYRMNGWVYLESGVGAIVGVKNTADSDWYAFTSTTTTGQWVFLTKSFSVPSGQTQARMFLAANNGVMTAYFDDIVVTEIQAADATPYANDGAIYGATYTTDRNGQSNQAMSFDGTDYVQITDAPAFSITQAISISFWMNPSATNTYIFDKIQANDGHRDYRMAFSSNKVLFTVFDTGGTSGDWDSFSSNATITAGEWVHVVVTFTAGGQGKIYLNGTLDNSGNAVNVTNGINNGTPLLKIGRHCCDENYFTGSMSDFRIYNYALSTTEIDQLYNSYQGSKIKLSLTDGLIGHWPLDTASGKSDTIVADATPNANNGTMSSMTVSDNATTDQKGQAGRAMSFDGSADYITGSDTNLPSGSAARTFAMWIYPTTFKNYQALLFYGTQSAGNGILFSTGGAIEGTDKLLLGRYTRNTDASTSSLSLNTWQHVVVTVDASGNVSFYIDGQNAGDTAISGMNTTLGGAYKIGDGWNASDNFTGSIADVRVYNRALSAEEIADLYHSYRPNISTGSLQKGLAGNWPLSEQDEKPTGSAMVANGTMEAAGSWGSYGTPTISERSTEQAHTGSYSWKVIEDSDYGGATQSITLTAGKTYRASAWIKRTSGATDAFFGVYQSSVGWAGNVSTSADGQWTYVSKVFEAPSGGNLIVWFGVNAVSGGSFTGYFDDITLTEIQAADATPNANDGTIYGATYTTDKDGQSNQAMSFDGSDDYLSVTNASQYAVGNVMSVSLWFQTTTARGNIIAKSNPTVSYGVADEVAWFMGIKSYTPGIADGTLQFGVYYNGDTSSSVVGANVEGMNDGKWHHAVGLFDSSDYARLYIDGVLRASSTSVWITQIKTTTKPITIGYGGSGLPFAGSVSGIRLYNRVLSAEEIQALYYKGR